MAKITTDELIESFKEMTLIELSEFVSKFEEVFKVTAAAPVAAAAAPVEPAAEAAPEKLLSTLFSKLRVTKKYRLSRRYGQ